MKKLAILFLSALALTSLFACGGSGSAGGSGKFGKGKEMALTFETNATTGYEWQYEFKNGDAEIVCERDREDIKPKEGAGEIGGPMMRTYFFRANKAGKTTLVYTYKRPWEGGETAYDIVYELSVDNDLVITCTDKKKGEVKSDKELDFFPNPVFTE